MAKKQLFGFIRCWASFVSMTVLGSASALAYTVWGTVTDESGQPLIGATVVAENAVNSRISADFDGQFVVSIPDDRTTQLRISYLGYATRTLPVSESGSVYIVMCREQNALDEVVLVGAGQQKNALLVSSLALTASGHDLADALGNAANMFTGNIPDLFAPLEPDSPDSRTVFLGTSMPDSVLPLVIVDGTEADLASVEVGEISDLSVLKDVSATALYGEKGANGAVIVTTRAEGETPFEELADDDGQAIAEESPENCENYKNFQKNYRVTNTESESERNSLISNIAENRSYKYDFETLIENLQKNISIERFDNSEGALWSHLADQGPPGC